MNWRESWRAMTPYMTMAGLCRLRDNLEGDGHQLNVGLTTSPDMILHPNIGNRNCECACPIAMSGWEKDTYKVREAHWHYQTVMNECDKDYSGEPVSKIFVDWWDSNGEFSSAREQLLDEVNLALKNFEPAGV